MKARNSGSCGTFAIGAILLSTALSACSGAVPDDGDAARREDELTLPSVCGGPGSLGCATGKFCLTPPGCCPGPHTFGLCVSRPRSCSATERLVCGCDGNTYANVCQAALAGTSVAELRACAPPPDPCENFVCKTGERCVPEPDGTTTCIPEACATLACKTGQTCIVLTDGTATCQ